MKKVLTEEDWSDMGWDHIPTCWELLEDIMENGINISFEMGGNTSWWCVLRDKNRNAIVPVQLGNTIDEAIEKLWRKLFCK